MQEHKLVREDDKAYTIAHPDGSHFAVIKSAIPKELHSKIRALPKFYAEGGKVKDDVPEPSKKNAQAMQKGATSGGTTLSQAWGNLKQGIAMNQGGQIQYYADGTPPGGAGAEDDETEAEAAAPSTEEGETETAEAAPGPGAAEAHASNPDLTVDSPMLRAELAKQNGSAGPQAPAAPQAGQLGSQAYDPMAAFKEQAQGLAGAAGAEAAGQAQSAQAIKQSQADTQKAVAPAQAHAQEAFNDANAVMDAIKNQKLDFNSLWHNMDTPSKVTATLSVILGGLGAGLSGQPNQALKVLNDLQDRDIAQQKADLGKKQSLYSAYMEKYHNSQQAELSARNVSNAGLQAKLAQIAATTKSEVVKQQATQQLGALHAQAQQYQNQLGLLGAQQQIMKQGAPTQNLPPVILQDPRAVDMNGTTYFTKDPKDAEKVKAHLSGMAGVENDLQRLKSFENQKSNIFGNRDVEGVINSLALNMAQVRGMRPSAEVIDNIKGEIKDPRTFRALFSGAESNSNDSLRAKVELEAEAFKRSYLHGYRPGATGSSTSKVVTPAQANTVLPIPKGV
jgi:hypothetical protein